jgi:hypothetical protein
MAKKKASTSSYSFYDHLRNRDVVERKLQKRKPLYTQGLVFVGMPFSPYGKRQFRAIREACRDLNLNARRVDQNAGSGSITMEIVELIVAAEFLIFDLTKERPNVYYELGFAHGVGNFGTNILLVAKVKTKLHFDVAPLRVQWYRTSDGLRNTVRKSLREMKRTGDTGTRRKKKVIT